MTIHTMSSNTSKGFIDRGLDRLSNFSNYFRRFNTSVEPILGTIRNMGSLISTGIATGNAIHSGIGYAMDRSRLMGAKRSLDTLLSHAQYFANDPENFTGEDLGYVNEHLGRIGRFINAYDNKNSSIPQEVIERFKDHSSQLNVMFEPENLELTRQDFINSRNTEELRGVMHELSDEFAPTDADYANENETWIHYINRHMKYSDYEFNTRLKRDIDSSVNEYIENRDINTKEGIRKSIKAVKDLSKIAAEHPTFLSLDTLGKMKYDIAVRVKQVSK